MTDNPRGQRADAKPLLSTAAPLKLDAGDGKTADFSGPGLTIVMYGRDGIKTADGAFTAFYVDGAGTVVSVGSFMTDPMVATCQQLMTNGAMPTGPEIIAGVNPMKVLENIQMLGTPNLPKLHAVGPPSP